MKNCIETFGEAQEIIKNIKKKMGNKKGISLVISKKAFDEIKKSKSTGFIK